MTIATLARRRGFHWAAFYSLCLFAWLGLFGFALDHPATPALGALDPGFDAAFWRTLCAASPVGPGLVVGFVMWAAMAAAMMAPTAVPLLATYRELTAGRGGAVAGFWALLGGYLLVWFGYAAVAAVAQRTLAEAALLSPHGISVSQHLTATLLVAAGLYQFSALKAACLSKCRSPLAFLLSRWRVGVSGAFRLGLAHGAVCVGCCWALMALAFVGGTMNLLWMGGAMVLMIVEKLPDLGDRLTKPLGCALVLAGGLAAAQALGVL